MSIGILQDRIDRYGCKTLQEYEQALREISQEIALLALFRSGFFKIAAFHGGTMLRVVHGMQRFSEDLDFCLDRVDPAFAWEKFVPHLRREFETYGYRLEIQDRSRAGSAVKACFLKDDSVGRLLRVTLSDRHGRQKKTRVKLEVDTNPPAGASTETRYVEFPIPFPVKVHDPATAFAGKIHALLRREYVKGRDWYDFVWYGARETAVNLPFLEAALAQSAPEEARFGALDVARVKTMLAARIEELDLDAVRADLERFCRRADLAIIRTWDRPFLLSRLERLHAF